MKIGFIDFFLDEWHANNLPAWIAEASGGKAQVALAWGLVDSPREGGRTNAAWSREMGIPLAQSLEQLIERCDALVVLSPDNCEMHEALCQLPLRSGKPVYVDKTFAPDLATAERIFALADRYHSPCFSCSALRFADEYQNHPPVLSLSAHGPGDFANYAVHQAEPLVMLTRGEPDRVMAMTCEGRESLMVQFKDGRLADLTCFGEGGFGMVIKTGKSTRTLIVESHYFAAFTRALLYFFETGISPVPRKDTLQTMALREAGLQALKQPGTWIRVPPCAKVQNH